MNFKNFRVDLHNHTPLCNHAEGSPQEYIEQAIKMGISHFGFSDHAPMLFDPDYRMSFNDLNNYFDEVANLKEIYKNKIDISIALEVDYLPKYHDNRVILSNTDYLIGSVHYLNEWGFDNPEFIGEYNGADLDDLWRRYFRNWQMAESNLFQIVGHFDLMKVFKFFPEKYKVEDLAIDTLRKIKKSGMVLEINGSGYRKPIGEPYPSIKIIEMAWELKIPITFGSDAHSPHQIGIYHDRIEKEAKKIGYKEMAIFKNRKIDFLPFI